MRYIVMIGLSMFLVTGTAFAAEAGDALRDMLELEKMEESAEEYLDGVDVSLDSGWEENLAALVESGTEQIGGELKRSVRSGVILLVIVLLCSLGEMGDQLGSPAVPMAGTLAVAAVAVADVNSLLGLGGETIDTITSFSNVVLPALTAISAVTGAITGASARYAASALFSGLLTNLINHVLTPAVYGFVAVNIGYAAVGNPGLKRMAAFLKWLTVTILTVTLLIFVGYLGMSGIMTGSADAAALKAAKFTISGAVPVVGGILADASESILASVGILKGTVGVFGMIVVLGICLLPFLRLAVHYLVYKLVSVLAATVGGGRICELIDSVGTAFGLVLGMTGACALLLLVTLVSCVRMVTV